MKYGKPITEEMIRQFRENYRNDRNAQVLNAAASQNDLSEIAYVPANAAKMKNVFSLEVKTRSITAQKKSGRCWLFAAMNMMREKIAEECNLEKFEFSNNYGAFWDKFEKMNFYLETVIETAGRDLIDDRLFDFVRGIGDGGYWAYAVNIIRKYGCVPSTEMIETFQSENTATMLKVLNTKLHKDALELRELVREGKDPQPRKQEMLNELFNSLCICLGEPVEKFDFEYTDKDGNYHVDRDLT
ncbi:MAG: aminopeptidase, partial [Erysipelotrichaceae bacterium]|nr:aminopeptidase [Erysipelotrichaceae bacterium]